MFRTELSWISALIAIASQTQPVAANVLRIDRMTGQATWLNSTDQFLATFGYEVRSPSGSIDPDAWRSIGEFGDADSGGSIDAVGIWDTFRSGPTWLAEGSSDGGLLVLEPGEALDLGAGLWHVDGEEDLRLQSFDLTTFELVPSPTEFFGELPPPDLDGDYNNNGLVEQADLDLVLLHWGTDAAVVPDTWINDLPNGLVDQDELDAVLLGWGNTAALGTASVPEPTTVMLFVLVIGAMLIRHYRGG